MTRCCGAGWIFAILHEKWTEGEGDPAWFCANPSVLLCRKNDRRLSISMGDNPHLMPAARRIDTTAGCSDIGLCSLLEACMLLYKYRVEHTSPLKYVRK